MRLTYLAFERELSGVPVSQAMLNGSTAGNHRIGGRWATGRLLFLSHPRNVHLSKKYTTNDHSYPRSPPSLSTQDRQVRHGERINKR